MSRTHTKIRFSVSFFSYKRSGLSLVIKQDNIERYRIPVFNNGPLNFDFDCGSATKIDFKIANKNYKDTLIQNNEVVKDTYLRLEHLIINNIDIVDKVNLFSNYQTDRIGCVRTNGYMNFNGTYSFKIRYPLSTHLLYCKYYQPKS